MASSNSTPFENASTARNLPEELFWESLKRAIAESSGFQRWQLERNSDNQLNGLGLDYRVRRYLRETLETLAY